MKNVIKPLTKRTFNSFRIICSSIAAGAGIHKKFLGTGNTTLIISNDEMKYIIKIVKSLEDSGLSLKGVTETIQNESKEQKRVFLSMLIGTIGASLLGNILAAKGINRAEEGVIRASY